MLISPYERYLESEAEKHQVKERLSVGDKIYVLNETNLLPAEVIKISNKSAKVRFTTGKNLDKIENFGYAKIVKNGDCVAVVCESWRGNAGRGGYRIERTHFQELRLPVEIIPKNLFIIEESLGVTPKFCHTKFLSQIQILQNATIEQCPSPTKPKI